MLPGDAVVHEVRCLTLSALGDYTAAAAGLNSLLSSAPRHGLDVGQQFVRRGRGLHHPARKLEQFVDTRSEDAAARFILAYQYLMLGEQDLAVAMLREVTRLQPQDSVAARMLTALDPPPAPS